MRKIIVLAALLAVFTFKSACAQFLTGHDLLAMCKSNDARKIYSCMHYVAGVVDYHVVMQSLGTAPTADFCLSSQVSIEEATVAVMTYLGKSPEHQAFIAAPAITMALHVKYPCAKPKAKTRKKKR